MTTWNVAGIGFAHVHMADNLEMVRDHPDAELVGICDEEPEHRTLSVEDTAREFALPEDRVYDDHRRLFAETDPDLVVLCPPPALHDEWVERVAGYDVSVILEKPFATSLEEADRMLSAMRDSAGEFAVNWPLAWYPPHRTTKRLVDEGAVGDVVEIHYYDGNRGSGRFSDVTYDEAGDLQFDEADAERDTGSWWYDPDLGGGSLQDYLGYGVTLGTWFRDGELPLEVTTETHSPAWTDVDVHSITIARYESGLSKYETRWGTYTDPWVDQPQPKCGFVVVGTDGTIGSYDYAETVRLQNDTNPGGTEVPVDSLEAPRQDPVQYVLHCLEHDEPVDFGPLDPDLCRRAQRIVDTARLSAERGETVELLE